MHVLTRSGALPWLVNTDAGARRSRIADGSEVRAGRHGNGDRRGWVLLLARSEEGKLREKRKECCWVLVCVLVCVCVRVPGQLVVALPRSRASQDYLCFDCLSPSRSLASKSENHPDG